MEKKFPRIDIWFILLVFIVSRLIVSFAGVEMDYGALYRYWQYLDVKTLQSDLLRGIWYDHTQPPVFNFLLGIVVKTSGSHAHLAFVLLLKVITLANTLLLLSILKKITNHPYIPLLLSLLYLLSPATMLFENELFYTSFITHLLLAATWHLQRLQKDIRWSDILGLYIPLILACLTRSMYHIVWLMALSIVILFWFSKRTHTRRLMLASLLSVLLVGGWYVKNYIIFHQFSTSTWMGMNMARNVFHDTSVTDSTQIASIEPFSKISDYQRFLPANYGSKYAGLDDRDLLQEWKNDSFINEKHVAYIEVSRQYSAESKKTIMAHPAAYVKNVLQSAIIFFAPATRYPTTEYLSEKIAWYDVLYSFNLSHFAKGKQQRRIAMTVSALPKFLIYVLTFFWLIREAIRSKKVLGRTEVPGGLLTIFITCIIGYIFIVSSFFEHYENMRFRYEAEPLFLILFAISLHYSRFKYIFTA